MRHVSQESSQRDYEPHVEIPGEVHHRLRERLPPEVRLGSREQDRSPTAQGGDARARAREVILGPLDSAGDAFYELDLGAHRLVIEVLFAVETRELFRLGGLLDSTQRETRRLGRVVPAREPGDEHRTFE